MCSKETNIKRIVPERDKLKSNRSNFSKYHIFSVVIVVAAVLMFSSAKAYSSPDNYSENKSFFSYVLASAGSFFKSLIFSSFQQTDSNSDGALVTYDRAEFEKQIQEQKKDIEEALNVAKKVEVKYNSLQTEVDAIKTSGLKIEDRTIENKNVENTIKILETIVSDLPGRQIAATGLSQSDFDSKISEIRTELNNLNTNLTNQINNLSSNTSRQTADVYHAVSLTNRIDNLSGTRLSNITVSGVSGLVDADIPDTITASSYLPLSGGTLTEALTGTSASFSSTLTVSGQTTLGNASTSLLTVSNGAWFTGGNVGIGTTTPNWNLQIASSTKTRLSLSDMSAGANDKHWLLSSMGGNFYVGTSTDALNATSTYLTINNKGYVGIGNTNPTTPLYVGNSVPNIANGSAVLVNGIADSTSNNLSGIRSIPTASPSSASSKSVTGLIGGPYSASSNLTNGTLIGIYAGGYYEGTGTLGNSYGAYFENSLVAAGTISNAYGVRILDTYKTAGTITTQYGLYIDNQAAGNTNYSIYSAGANNYFGGNVGIATTSPVSTLSVQGSLCVRSTGSCGTTDGTIYATTATITDIDLAENYQTMDDTLTSGEIVSLDLSNAKYIKRASQSDDTPLLGIISTAPGILLGRELSNSKPVALSGRVPLKVNNEGGAITIGDKIALSSVSGVGMKANNSSETVAMALEPFNGTQGVIEVFVNLRQAVSSFQNNNNPGLAIAASGNQSVSSDSVASSVLEKMKNLIIAGKEFIAEKITVKEAVFEYVSAGEITAKKITAKKIELEDEDTGEVYCIRVKNGELDKIKGVCGNSQNNNNNAVTSNSGNNSSVNYSSSLSSASSSSESSSVPPQFSSSSEQSSSLSESASSASTSSENSSSLPDGESL